MAGLEAIGAAMIRGWARTLRVTFHASNGQRVEPNDPWLHGRVYAVCERDILSLLPFAAHHEYVTAVATGRDGNRATAVLSQLGVHVARGSVRRDGAQAIQSLRRLMTPARSVVLSVDGPLGPAGVAKPGVMVLGARCRREVVPLAAAARWSFRFPWTWSGIYLPLPFSRVSLQSGEPLPAGGAADRHMRTEAAAIITARLHEARRQAHARVRAS
jgi:lysophospholipid acyltransferase (LPLAT)-like uncharacterized protein